MLGSGYRLDIAILSRGTRQAKNEARKVDERKPEYARSVRITRAITPRRYGSPRRTAPTVLRPNVYSPFRAS